MARIKTKQVQGVGRITLEYAIDQFMRHNRLKNLSPRTIEYYTEGLWSLFGNAGPVAFQHS